MTAGAASQCLVWAVTNQKGGVGKTTTAVALGGLLAAEGRRVLLVDLDPHASLSSYFALDPDAVGASAFELFEAAPGAPPPAIHRLTPTLGLVPASPALATLDRRLGNGNGMGLVLGRWVDGLRPRYQHILLDCAPMLGLLMVNALVASDRVLVPAQTEFLSLNGVRRMQRTIQMIERSRARALPWLVVPTMFDRRTRAAPQSLAALHEEFGAQVWAELIPVDTRLREAARAGQPPAAFAPHSRGVQAYRRLLEHLLGRAAAPRAALA